ncbi:MULTISPECIES: DUF721 domain-containing protein [Galbibacter]|uniref:DUF721 domain-containing protein n=1 Tax=Galbibacter pacificus TaxID=2996052 RepID=A0ABT6FNI3_9FLAO|nr:DUF721 domain-containing protein [Galbibacter pacificus]MDG3581338.1 DUF721 domain-containing protein [Galbibacter pacificus]MDG3584816.1 DUF721 domain-containing protein [Galbibacter pacificus]
MSKRRNEYISLNEALKEFVQENKLDKGMDKVDVKNAWQKLMGNGVNNYTTQVVLKRNVLYVSLSSAVLRQELSYGKEKIVTMLNEELGKEVVKSIVLR